jgi:hypothetical protein
VDFSFIISGNAAAIDAGNAMTLLPHKMRDDEWPKPIAYRLIKIPDLVADGTPWKSGALERTDPPVQVSEFSPIPARVYRHIENNPGCSAQSIRDSVQGSNDEIHYEKNRLLRLGAIENQGGPNRHRYHVVPGWHVSAEWEVEQDRKENLEDVLGIDPESDPGSEEPDR